MAADSQAAEATFGTAEWPADVPTPQAWIELDVESAEAVGAAIAEMQAGGHRVLREAHEEPWSQTTARLISPEGLLVGVTFTPWMHEHEHPHSEDADHRVLGTDRFPVRKYRRRSTSSIVTPCRTRNG